MCRIPPSGTGSLSKTDCPHSPEATSRYFAAEVLAPRPPQFHFLFEHCSRDHYSLLLITLSAIIVETKPLSLDQKTRSGLTKLVWHERLNSSAPVQEHRPVSACVKTTDETLDFLRCRPSDSHASQSSSSVLQLCNSAKCDRDGKGPYSATPDV